MDKSTYSERDELNIEWYDFNKDTVIAKRPDGWCLIYKLIGDEYIWNGDYHHCLRSAECFLNGIKYE